MAAEKIDITWIVILVAFIFGLYFMISAGPVIREKSLERQVKKKVRELGELEDEKEDTPKAERQKDYEEELIELEALGKKLLKAAKKHPDTEANKKLVLDIKTSYIKAKKARDEGKCSDKLISELRVRWHNILQELEERKEEEKVVKEERKEVKKEIKELEKKLDAVPEAKKEEPQFKKAEKELERVKDGVESGAKVDKKGLEKVEAKIEVLKEINDSNWQELIKGGTHSKEWFYFNRTDHFIFNVYVCWKIHVYCGDINDSYNVAKVLIPFLDKHKLTFKVPSSKSEVENLFADDEQRGKVFTIYLGSHKLEEDAIKREARRIFKMVEKEIIDNKLTLSGKHIVGDRAVPEDKSGRMFYRFDSKVPGLQRYSHENYESNRGKDEKGIDKWNVKGNYDIF